MTYDTSLLMDRGAFAPREHGTDHGASHGAQHGAEHGAPHGAEHGANGGANGGAEFHTAETIAARLEEAGETLLCLPPGGYTTRLRTSSWNVLDNAAEAYGTTSTRLPPPVPPAARITRMDEALSWLGLIPDDKYVLRRIVASRMLVSPHTGRHLFPWRRLATLLGADHKAIQRWHAQGIDILVGAVNRK